MSSEDSKMWKAYKAMKSSERKARRDAAPDMLRKAGISFSLHNEGAHIVLYTKDGSAIDFWPGTTKWATRTIPKVSDYGIDTLLKHAFNSDKL